MSKQIFITILIALITASGKSQTIPTDWFKTDTITIDSKIQKAQDAVLRTKERYEKAMSVLEKLIAVRKERQMKSFMEALEKSDRSSRRLCAF